MKRKKYGFLAYLIPALILIGILIFAVVHSLRIYIPQMREQGDYDELKKRVSENSGSSGTVVDGAVRDAEPDGTKSEDEDEG